jgi:hypothetical protein
MLCTDRYTPLLPLLDVLSCCWSFTFNVGFTTVQSTHLQHCRVEHVDSARPAQQLMYHDAHLMAGRCWVARVKVQQHLQVLDCLAPVLRCCLRRQPHDTLVHALVNYSRCQR